MIRMAPAAWFRGIPRKLVFVFNACSPHAWGDRRSRADRDFLIGF